MGTEIQSCFVGKQKKNLVTLFGYSSRSVPGIEINGLGKWGKLVKEKIIFITRSRSLPIPLKRFVLNVEVLDGMGKLETSNIQWLELPLLTLYWYLASLLPILTLENCFIAGSLSPRGEVKQPSKEVIFSNDILQKIQESKLNVIVSSSQFLPPNIQTIDIKDLFRDIPSLEL